MTLLQAALVGICFYLASAYNGIGFYLAKYALCRPLIGGLLCGIILGDIQTGLEVGVTLQLAYMGVFAVGGAGSMDIATISYPCAALAIASKLDAGTAVALSASLSALASHTTNIARAVNVPFNKMYIDACEKGDERGMHLAYNVYPQLVFFAVRFGVAFALCYFGTPLVDQILAVLPAKLMYALGKLAKIIASVGMGMLLKYLVSGPWSFAFFVFGFALYSYSGMNFLNVAIWGVVFAYLYYRSSGVSKAAAAADDDEEVL